MKNAKRPSLLLTELICGLLIFVICAVVCVALLVRADTASRRSGALTDAVFLAQTAAEQFKTGVDAPADRAGECQAQFALREAEGVDYLDITVWWNDEAIYTVTAARLSGEDAS